MKRVRHNFSLTEVLTVIAIVGILAAITAPVVIMSRDRGRETQAKGDITAIVTALKQLEADYHKVLKKTGNDYYIGDSKVDVRDNIANVRNEGSKRTKRAYDVMIIELSAPKTEDFPVSVNKRKKVYLDPKKEFDPSIDYDDYYDDDDDMIAQTESLYRDPWGNPYVVYIKVTRDEQLAIPGTSKTIPGNFAAYSFGANGTDDKGCNADLENCISSGTHRDHDDIASWNI